MTPRGAGANRAWIKRRPDSRRSGRSGLVAALEAACHRAVPRRALAFVLAVCLLLTGIPGGAPAYAVFQSSVRVALVPGPAGALCCAGTMPTSGVVTGTQLSFGGFQFTNVPVTSVSLANLATFDTLVLLQVGTSSLTTQQRTDINTFVDTGGKLILYDSDATTGQDYTWLIRPFSTFAPCANCGLQGGTLSVVENNTLGSADSSSPNFINAAEIPPNTDAVGDANVVSTSDPSWFGHIRATNARNQTGWVHAYAQSPSGKGLILYNGLDSDFIGSAAPYASGIDWLAKLWYRELSQQWNPHGLPGTTPIAGASGDATNPAFLGEQPLGATSPDPVNLATGVFTNQAEDLALPGRVLGLSFTRWYNSADATAGPLGPGWTHGYNWTLTEAASSVVIRRGDGRQDTFTRNADGTYADPPNVFDTLTKNADATFSLTLTNQVAYSFSTAGQLTRIREPAGNQITLAYAAGKLSTITDTAGRAVTLGYDASNRLTSLTDPLGRKVTYAYDGSGRLTTVTDKIGNTAGQTPALHQWKYTYDAATRHITTITDPDGRVRVTNTYDAQGRVPQQRDGLSAVTTFAYGAGQTVLTDPRAHATTYTFDSRMRVLTQSDVVGGPTFTLSYTYDAVGNRKSATDRRGKTTDFTYDTRGNVLTKTDPSPDGVAPRPLTAFAYDAKNNITRITDAKGFPTNLTYHAQDQRAALGDAPDRREHLCDHEIRVR